MDKKKNQEKTDPNVKVIRINISYLFLLGINIYMLIVLLMQKNISNAAATFLIAYNSAILCLNLCKLSFRIKIASKKIQSSITKNINIQYVQFPAYLSILFTSSFVITTIFSLYQLQTVNIIMYSFLTIIILNLITVLIKLRKTLLQ